MALPLSYIISSILGILIFAFIVGIIISALYVMYVIKKIILNVPEKLKVKGGIIENGSKNKQEEEQGIREGGKPRRRWLPKWLRFNRQGSNGSSYKLNGLNQTIPLPSDSSYDKSDGSDNRTNGSNNKPNGNVKRNTKQDWPDFK